MEYSTIEMKFQCNNKVKKSYEGEKKKRRPIFLEIKSYIYKVQKSKREK